MTQSRLFLIDGSALAFRSFFAFGAAPLRSKSEEMETSAIFGFASTLLRLLEKEKPTHIAVVFDSKEPTFRHKLYEPYKATRERMPEELAQQLPFIREIVEAMNIPFIVMPSFEADDIIGTLVKQARKREMEAYMVTGDKDFMQLLEPGVYLYNLKKGDLEIGGIEAPVKKFGVTAEQVIDLLALMGDSSDNVPGVPGVGEKTAQKLIQQFGSLEKIYENLDQVTPAGLQEKLRANKEQAFLCRQLVTIDCCVPVVGDPLDFTVKEFQREKLKALFERFEFRSLLKSIPAYTADSAAVLQSNSSRQYHAITNETDLISLCEKLNTMSEFAVDTETTGLNTFQAKLLAISISYQENVAYCIHVGDATVPLTAVQKHLGPILANPKISKGGQNIKYDLAVLNKHGLGLAGISFDTMLASYLIAPDSRAYSLDALSEKYLSLPKIPTQALIGSGKNQITMDQVDPIKVTEYACEDADYTFRLHQLLKSKLLQEGLNTLYTDLEVPLIEVLSEMETHGIALDVPRLKDLSKTLTERLRILEIELHELAGESFNINSPKQLGVIIYEKLKIHTQLGLKRIKKTKTGYSTDQDTLETMSEHALVKRLLEYRNLNKLLSTYIDVLPTLVEPSTGRIHTSFNQTIAATGRLSSSDPNLQNIPIRNELGKEIRKAFIAGAPDSVLLSADYSQIELRILAHLSGDEDLINTFSRDEDIHQRTAEKIFQKASHEVTSDLRGQAKAINFGLLYGMGPNRLARETGISLAEAKHFIEVYFSTFPKIKAYLQTQIEFAKEKGYVETILKRKRPLPEITNSNPGIAANAERMATNTPIQGSAADLIKIAMLNIHRRFKKENLQTKMLLQVHDELIFEAPRSEAEYARKLVIEEMQNAIALKVPLKVECRIGANWSECH